MTTPDVPAFARRSPLVADAYRFAFAVHEGPRSLDDTRIEHPVEVASLLCDADFPDTIVAAALLHDVLEDTTTQLPEVRRRFGPAVADLVARLSEDPAIAAYPDRKAALRETVADGGRDAAAIFTADKLANARALQRDDRPMTAERLDHYRATVVTLRTRYPDLPYLTEVDAILDGFHPKAVISGPA